MPPLSASRKKGPPAKARKGAKPVKQAKPAGKAVPNKQVKKTVRVAVKQDIRVVGIGASAGGLEALSELLREIPSDINMAFLLIQHLDPKRRSILPELLAKESKVQVIEATDGMKLEPNRVYVMPSNVDIALTDGHFGLTPRSKSSKPHLPIDIFLDSLAKIHGSDAIGVILSGTASDGTMGVQAIRAAGGVTFAQDPETAKFDGMPHSAIVSGCIDFVLSPKKIAEELTWMAEHRGERREPTAIALPKTDEGVFNAILQLVSHSQSADFREYKPNTIHRRTHQRMSTLGVTSLAGYLNYLHEHPEEIGNLSQHILIPVTEFFRNPEVFEELATKVYPKILAEKSKESLRLWVVACSSGEEVYSLAITLLEFLGARASSVRMQIFGTDINEKGINKARNGFYTEKSLKNVSEERMARFFTKAPGGYRVNKSIRDLCVFARQDVTKDPPFSNMDLISCRNFLIYVQTELQERVISTLHYALNATGFLLLGNAESAASYPLMFEALNKKSRVYQKKVINQRKQRTFQASGAMLPSGTLPIVKVPVVSRDNLSDTQLQQAADRLVIKSCAPVGAVVNDALEVVQFRGRTAPFLEPASGRANLNILSMVREELAVALRTAIAAARKTSAPVKKKSIEFEYHGKKRAVHISVIPMEEPNVGMERYLLILFAETTPLQELASKSSRQKPLKASDVALRKLLEQKKELQAARLLLREQLLTQESLREDYQSANEELLSANEELQSSNEEMETSKEELESANEELTTVNDELNSSNSALHMIGNDLKNLLDSTVIPVVMVDGGLCIRRMTPMAETVFKVLSSDIGRPITDIRPDINVDLKPLLITVLRDMVNLEQEVQDQDGRWHRLQIRPYKTLDNKIDGAVLILVDIDAIKKRNQELIRVGELTKSIIETMPGPVLVLNSDLRVQMANHSFYHSFGVEPKTTLHEYVYSLGNGQWDKPGLRVLLEGILPHRRDFSNHELEYDFPDIGWKSFLLSGRYMVQELGAPPLILLSFADITQRKKTESALIQAEKLAIASRLAASISHEINNPLEAITNLLYLASTDDDAAGARSFVNQALQELSRVSYVTQQTLKFYRQSTLPTRVQMSEILDSLLVLYHGKLSVNNIIVHRKYPGDPSVLCLEGDLRQVFANIISNAIDAMPSAGTLTIRVRVSTDWRNREQQGVRITIADSGVGMQLQTLHRIYEPFFTTKKDTGTGLGMWVSAQLVERLQGNLHVWSTTRPGRSGTAFSLFLPEELARQKSHTEETVITVAAAQKT